jgi:hypothetical protein
MLISWHLPGETDVNNKNPQSGYKKNYKAIRAIRRS